MLPPFHCERPPADAQVAAFNGLAIVVGEVERELRRSTGARVWSEKDLVRRANRRLAVPRHAEEVSGNVAATLPHLFQRCIGSGHQVFSPETVRHWLERTLVRAPLHDTDGTPLRFTPHDFRRLFATSAVNTGLPIHIAAALLGHRDLNTTKGYTNPRELHRMGENPQVAC